MPTLPTPWSLVLLWFITYWILGGVFFSLITATNLIRLNKTRFSCLFTIGSIVAAYAAAAGGVLLAHPGRHPECSAAILVRDHGIGTLLTCNFPAVLASGALCFTLLMMGGLIAMLFSRVQKGK
jgi:hypothetical protein